MFFSPFLGDLKIQRCVSVDAAREPVGAVSGTAERIHTYTDDRDQKQSCEFTQTREEHCIFNLLEVESIRAVVDCSVLCVCACVCVSQSVNPGPVCCS